MAKTTHPVTVVRCCFPFSGRHVAPCTYNRQGFRQLQRCLQTIRHRNRIGCAPSTVIVVEPVERSPEPAPEPAPEHALPPQDSNRWDLYAEQLRLVPTTLQLVLLMEELQGSLSSTESEERARAVESCNSLRQVASQLPHVNLEAVRDVVPPDIWTIWMREDDSPSSSVEDQVLCEDFEEEEELE